jgi:hypothetical protein
LATLTLGLQLIACWWISKVMSSWDNSGLKWHLELVAKEFQYWLANLTVPLSTDPPMGIVMCEKCSSHIVDAIFEHVIGSYLWLNRHQVFFWNPSYYCFYHHRMMDSCPLASASGIFKMLTKAPAWINSRSYIVFLVFTFQHMFGCQLLQKMTKLLPFLQETSQQQLSSLSSTFLFDIGIISQIWGFEFWARDCQNMQFSLYNYSLTIEFSSIFIPFLILSKTWNIIPDNLESKLVWNLEINLLATLNTCSVRADVA